MMLKILLLAFIVGTASASVAIAPLPPKPSEFAHWEGCYIKDINTVVPVGTSVTPIGRCTRILCESTFLQYTSCGGGVGVGSGRNKCFISDKDLSKPFPECCPKLVC